MIKFTQIYVEGISGESSGEIMTPYLVADHRAVHSWRFFIRKNVGKKVTHCTPGSTMGTITTSLGLE